MIAVLAAILPLVTGSGFLIIGMYAATVAFDKFLKGLE